MGSWTSQTTYDPITGEQHRFRAYTPDGIAGRGYPLSADRLEREAATRERITRTLLQCSSASEWVLRHSETAASTTIEGVYPSLRRLAEAEIAVPRRGSAEAQAIGCAEATEHAQHVGRSGATITLGDICTLQSLVVTPDTAYTARHEPGAIRSGNVWVGHGGNPNEADHVAPPPEAVSVLLDDLLEYLNEDDDPPLVQAAVAHAQFERIHPFPDGNGRAGRALIHLVFSRRGVVSQHSFPISGALAAYKNDYFAILRECHEPGDIDPAEEQRCSHLLVDWFLDMSCVGAGLTERADSMIRRARQQWSAQLSGRAGVEMAERLLEEMTRHPVCDPETAAQLLSVTPRQAKSALKLLEDIGIAKSHSMGKGRRGYRLLDLLGIYSAILADKPFMVLEEVEAAQAAQASKTTAGSGVCCKPTRTGPPCRRPVSPGRRCPYHG